MNLPLIPSAGMIDDAAESAAELSTETDNKVYAELDKSAEKDADPASFLLGLMTGVSLTLQLPEATLALRERFK